MQLFRLLTAILITFVIVGCSKDPEQAKGQMTAEIDGTVYQLNDFTEADFDNLAGDHLLSIGGQTTSPQYLSVQLIVSCPSAFEAGTYRNPAVADTTVSAFLTLAPAEASYTGGYELNDVHPVRLTITSFADKRLKGTFEATVMKNGDIIEIKNGSFDIPSRFVKPG